MEHQVQTRNSAISNGDYQVRLSDEPLDPEWDSFVSSLPHGHHVQTSLWGQVKSTLGYRTMRVTVAENGRIVAGGQFLIRQLMPFFSIAYMPKGPLYPTWDPSLVPMILDELKKVAQTDHFLVFTLQPANKDPEFEACLADRGFRPSWLELAPTATILHDLTQDTQEILRQMKRQTRQKINRSEREGITTREGTEADLPTFYDLYLTTSEKQGFTPYPEEYFARMWRVFSQQGVISLIIAEYQGTPVSALLLVGFGSTVCPKILGWSGEHGKRRPNDALFWAAIQWAKSHGYHCFDMEGIDREGAELKLSGQPLPEELRRTPDHFKLGYGGTVTLLPESYYFVPSHLWRWPYHQVFGLEGRGQAVQRNFELYRRRFG
ncbi:MAG: peptidoglycan bridge formation glycyltransferase FemA/FemB family protein [Anaerolineae bacterium]|jgi:lipid II:glycine glycyltransferase (peptidoglycan interpeptide bridge formation enzyme)